MHKDLETRHCAKLLFQSARVSFNEFASKKNNKFFFIFYKSVHSEIFGLKQIDPIYDKGVSFRRARKLKAKTFNLRFLSAFDRPNFIIQSCLKSSKKLARLYRNYKIKIFSKISASVFSFYFANQMRLSLKMRDGVFKSGLQKGITRTLRRYFRGKNKSSISGIRVTIAGKWSKTRAGRKQKLSLNFGRLYTQTVNSFIDYDVKTVATKFGACSIKVLISYKNLKTRF